MKKKILLLSKYGVAGPSSRYRSYNYYPYFQKEGLDIEFKPLFDDDYIKKIYNNRSFYLFFLQLLAVLKRIIFLLKNYRRYDAFIIEKDMFPFLPLWLEKLFLNHKPYALDFDDHVAASYQSSRLKNKILGNKISELVKHSKFTTVGNRWYFTKFKEGNLIYLPTVIDLDKYPIHNIISKTKTIVWIGSPSTVKYLKLLEPVFVELSSDIDFVLRIIGGEIKLDSRINVEYISWSAESENRLLAESTIGIMPLEETEWEKGKCGFKLIQYLASGIPVVASKLPANEEIITQDCGFIANDLFEWKKYLRFLLENPLIAEEMGVKGRLRVEEYYSYQIWGERYADMIKSKL
ncbi:glycosyltransferase family 4 protein [Riemerella anatipestifer]|uniref:glycosyltransferase family 4 protein n=1 Tax=Riemerella anatipestifer TaxID=34085 RepID=UPI00208E3095|nr:glycosyltransferase family 4 protein [Riemerella anatipestifer]MCO4303045.1 glycosyltransferase family 4 protein [Riemerella anatipestifer]MCQ4038577.1 glycosyltransferase family 4 protein [Riemerella anatipestifer]MCT6760120.1 glycosyltransferase family 4 protein [Riemerella anatipestifer]MCT6772657.1 glycosyltransferase family 4 protein [Riemerella anatipestifer]MCU7575834.1 glycosyltransferase family 4 protein [Riemerella anatipestifer]